MESSVAAIQVQFHLMKTMPSMVMDSGLWTDLSEPDLLATTRAFVQVYCECPYELARQRVADRKRWDSGIANSEFERFRPLLEPLRLPHPLVVVPTHATVDLAAVAEEVRATMLTVAPL